MHLWRAVVSTVFADVDVLCQHNPGDKFVTARIGRCSHWLRPHQTRWKADGGFAGPIGYGGRRYSRAGFPQYDWSVALHWNADDRCWSPESAKRRWRPRRDLRFYASIPARTTRHAQAAIYTKWAPGSPPEPKKELVQFYGFRRVEGIWQCTADGGPGSAYDVVAEHSSPPDERPPSQA